MSHQWNGEDNRDSLTAQPDREAKVAPTCKGCGYVVYAVGVRLPYGVVLCRLCAEAAQHEPKPDGETFRGQEAVGYLAEQQQAAQRLKR